MTCDLCNLWMPVSPTTVLSRIDTPQPDLLKHLSALGCHERVAPCLRLADHGGLLAAPDCHAMAMIGSNQDAAFMTHRCF